VAVLNPGHASQELSAAPTPALVLDRGKLLANCARMKARCRMFGVQLRPHMKTLKSIEVARHALESPAGPIAVATLNEARYFADRGIGDIQYAVCISPDKLAQAASILQRDPRFSFFLDSVEVARSVVEFCRSSGTRLRVWIEIDSGEHRTGMDYRDPQFLQTGRLLADPAVVFEGVATHGGHSYHADSIERLREIAEQERSTVAKAAATLRHAGIPCARVSAGSTPTAVHAASAEGLTEWRAGVYMAGDLFQVAVGSLSLADVAVTVLATVISHSRGRNQIVVDAGGLALSKDRSTASGPGPDLGYGLILDVAGEPLRPDITIAGVHQEHGEIRGTTALPFEKLPIGARVRIVPNHVCMTAAMYDRYLVVDGSDRVIDVWERTNGWS
jgi:D-serine deaminase-like pyridoxal phosphate-dependent protein